MAKDKSETPAERAARKAAKASKKDSKAAADTDEVLHTKVDDNSVKKHKKDKHREKKEAKKAKEDALLKEAANGASKDVEEIEEEEEKADEEMGGLGVTDTNGGDVVAGKKARPAGALVKFADPLADEKGVKRLLKGVEKAAKAKCLKRGVKEVNKAIKYTPTRFASPPESICIVAGDISPMDVISHIPVFCEKHFIPYVFVPSRDKLGQAGLTTRPTSVVLVGKEAKSMSAEEKATWLEEYKSLCKIIDKTPRRQPIV